MMSNNTKKTLSIEDVQHPRDNKVLTYEQLALMLKDEYERGAYREEKIKSLKQTIQEEFLYREHQDDQIANLQKKLREAEEKLEANKEFIREQDDVIKSQERELASQEISIKLLKAQASEHEGERHRISNKLINGLHLFEDFKLGQKTPPPEEVLEAISRLIKDGYRFEKFSHNMKVKVRFADANGNDKGWIVFKNRDDAIEYARRQGYTIMDVIEQ